MMYNLIGELLTLVKKYEGSATHPKEDIFSFLDWLNVENKNKTPLPQDEPIWEGKTNGRSADSVINTSLVHLYRYARLHAKTAVAGSPFSTPDEFIYLITLSSGGNMSKTALIKANIHEKATGTLIINRLIEKGLVEQQGTDSDKRARIIHVTPKGRAELGKSIENIKLASAKVTQPLSREEKLELIGLLLKLEDFHYERSLERPI
ncbi:MarR family winged helix-turn-helix transcriptional regulator [Pedobacter jamesrossensis]|uniref:MarR family winged helix-turn-helix transcriptional regulator n=1 Tax=Pedobacter jamesrossensis TaxID=1908238 RepID=A0ABV8NP73_9SPHI